MSFPRLHYLPDGRTDDFHLGSAEPVTSGKIAGSASRANITAHMRQSVINAIKPSGGFVGAAVDARLFDEGENFGRREVAVVDLLVSRAQKNGPAFVGSAVAQLPGASDNTLIVSHVRPTINPAIAALLSLPMARPALIRNAATAASVCAEKLGRCWKFLVAAMTLSHVGAVAFPHNINK